MASAAGTVIYRLECSCCSDRAAMTSGSRAEKNEAKNKVDYDKVICSMSEWVAGSGKEQREHTSTAKKSLWIVAANGLEAVWFSVRISKLVSCNACQEQHLLKRCLSDGQKCAGANTDSLHTGAYSVLTQRGIISPDHAIWCWHCTKGTGDYGQYRPIITLTLVFFTYITKE